MAEACREWRGDLAAMAAGALGDAERARVVAHIDGCDGCHAEFRELRQSVALLFAADPVWLDRETTPPAELPARIIAQVRAEKTRRRRTRLLRILGAAAAAMLVALIAVIVVSARDNSEHLTSFAAAAPGVEGRYSVARNDQGTTVRLQYRGLDRGDVYWLWLTDASGKRVSAGTFRGGGDQTITLQSAMPTANATRIWVTDAHDAVLLDSRLEH